MDLPAAVAALAARLDDSAEFLPDPELFHAPELFAAERERIFLRSPVAIDHVSRIAENGRYFRCDAALGSILLTRDAGGVLHALRNVCLHAGYPICEAEEGAGEPLICPYHGWEYALDGRLVEPELSARIDPARLRLKHYAVGIEDGLIVVDPGGAPGLRRPAGRILPDWLADATVCRRARWSAAWNWKSALQFIKASPRLFLDDVGAGDAWQAFGPLSLIRVGRSRAALLQVIPKGAGHTLLRLVEMTAPGAGPSAAAAEDGIGEDLRQAAGGGPPVRLDRAFFAWYGSLMSAD